MSSAESSKVGSSIPKGLGFPAGMFADNEVVEFESLSDEEVEDLSVDHYADLRVEAVSAQRLSVSRNAVEHVEGRREVVTFDAVRKMTDEKMFKVSKLIDWVSGSPDAVIDALAGGRVRTRVSAAMGMGKSTLLPSLVARRLDHRVLYVSLDANALGSNSSYMRRAGLGGFKRHWRSKPQAWLCCMTYGDFCAYAGSSRRADLFKRFETVIFDEAFLSTPEVKAAMKIFAVLAGPETNLLLCSANIRTDSIGTSAASAGQGNVKVCAGSITPEQAVQSGKLIDEYLCDRLLVVLPSDERISDMAAYYESNGVDVRMLHTATRHDELDSVRDWLTGDSITPRVVVAHTRYSISHNIPISFVINFALESKMKIEGDRVVFYEVPMTETMVGQGMSRAGRGIVEGSGGIVMSDVRSEEGSMTFSEKVLEYVLLTQAYIKPRHTPEWEAVHKLFPNGLSPRTAQLILKVNLPVEVTMRYLAADGQFAAKFVDGLRVYSHSDHFVQASAHEYPIDYEDWVEEPVFGSKGGPVVKVPFYSDGEVQVIMHSVFCISERLIKVPRWRLNNLMKFEDGGDSDVEGEDTAKMQRRRLVKVRSFEKLTVEAPKVRKAGWSHAAVAVNEELGGARSRAGGVIARDRFKEAMKGMLRVVDDYKPLPVPMELMEAGQGTVGQLELPVEMNGVVESPGGSIVCELPGSLCEALNSGVVLNAVQFQTFLDAYRVHGSRLIISKLFDCYSNPWTSVVLAFLDREVVDNVIKRGLSSYAYNMLSHLNGRFAAELVVVVKSSNVYKRRYAGLFSRAPSVDEIMSAIRKGKFTGIAQSDKFIHRIVQIKRWIDESLIMAENQGVFLPMMITEAQRTLPIHGSSGLGHVAQGHMVEQSYRSDNPMSSSYEPRVRRKGVGQIDWNYVTR